ncbi:MAG: hypothetical protein ACRESZ_03430 [Methylococcales bacterium]
MEISVVSRDCPGCGKELNPQKVHDGNSWWDKCHNQECFIGYVSRELHEIELKDSTKLPPSDFNYEIVYV